jgi:hypothetical protein
MKSERKEGDTLWTEMAPQMYESRITQKVFVIFGAVIILMVLNTQQKFLKKKINI